MPGGSRVHEFQLQMLMVRMLWAGRLFSRACEGSCSYPKPYTLNPTELAGRHAGSRAHRLFSGLRRLRSYPCELSVPADLG